jgi:hypothetical protein
MVTRAKSDLNEEDWLKGLGNIRAEALLPGFWTNLAENCSAWAGELSASPFWTEAKGRLDHWRNEYRESTGGDLLSQPGLPNFVSKPENSIREKLFRRCKQERDYL